MDIELFRDREDAGHKLAERLKDWENRDAVVLAIPRGGVPVGFEVARILHAPFDVIVPRKLPIPWNPEAGFGAITADGTMVLNEPMIGSLDLTESEVRQTAEEVREEILRRTARYRADRPPLELEGRPVILVDDGLASGYTMLAAIESVRKQRPSAVIAAVPVSSRRAAHLVNAKADKLIAMMTSERLPFAVASFYRKWHDLTDEDVIGYLQRSWGELTASR